LISYWPGSLHWHDHPLTKDGSVVLLQSLGKVDPSIIQIVGYDNLIQFHIWCMEALENICSRTVIEKGYWPGFIMIEDLEGVGYHTFTTTVLGMAQELVKINQNFYPDMLRKMYIVNVPSVFYMFWKVIQLWLEPRSLAKMELVNGKTTLIYDKIEAIFDLSTLPIRLGGSSTKDIPPGGYLGLEEIKMREEAKYRVDVARGTKHEVTHHFEEGDSVYWEFVVENYDIGFGIFCDSKEIHKIPRCEAKKVFAGHLSIETTGSYLFQWDNSYSWTKGKTIKYNITKGLELL